MMILKICLMILMKAVMISIKPKWCELIAEGKKTIEVRKTKPKIETPFKCYIYCTNTKPYLVWGDVFKGDWETEFTHLSGYNRKDAEKIWDVFNGKVIGEFVCDGIEDFSQWEYEYDTLLRHINLYAGTNGDYKFLSHYLNGQKKGYAWHISDLVVYDKPKELNDFHAPCDSRCDGMCFEGVECCRIITRPPQSWCYVEELKGE